MCQPQIRPMSALLCSNSDSGVSVDINFMHSPDHDMIAWESAGLVAYSTARLNITGIHRDSWILSDIVSSGWLLANYAIVL